MTIGIYSITNKIDGKKYIGKSKNIEARFTAHKWSLKLENKDRSTNRYLWSSVQLHGIDNFLFEIIEEFDILDEEMLMDKELYYMDLHKSCERDFGYNLRRDSSTACEVHQDTRKLISENTKGELNGNFGNKWTDEQKDQMSKIKKKQVADGLYDWMKTEEWSNKASNISKNTWKDKDKLAKMSEKVALLNSTLRFYEYDKITKELINVWESMHEILTENPDYHRIAIYSVCNGHKKSYRGSIWKSELK